MYACMYVYVSMPVCMYALLMCMHVHLYASVSACLLKSNWEGICKSKCKCTWHVCVNLDACTYMQLKIRCIYLYLCMMYACMYVSMYVCMYVCMNVYMYECMYACMNVWMYVWMYECMHVCMNSCMFVCSFVSLYVCLFLCLFLCFFLCSFVRSFAICQFCCCDLLKPVQKLLAKCCSLAVLSARKMRSMHRKVDMWEAWVFNIWKCTKAGNTTLILSQLFLYVSCKNPYSTSYTKCINIYLHIHMHDHVNMYIYTYLKMQMIY